MGSTAGPTLRLVFMGTAGFAVPSLEALAAGPSFDRRRLHSGGAPGRPRPAPRPSAVQVAAERLGLPLRHPGSLRDACAQGEFAALGADLAVVAAYGLILSRPILEAPRLGCINLHASLLPRWRGAAPIQRAILAGDRETGITIFQIEPALDTGPILAMERISITNETTAESLQDKLAALAARMVLPVIDDLAAGRARPRPQPQQGVTYAAKIDKAEGRLDWSQPAHLARAPAARAQSLARLLDRCPRSETARSGRRGRWTDGQPRRGAR